MSKSKAFSALWGLIVPDIIDTSEDGLSSGMVKSLSKVISLLKIIIKIKSPRLFTGYMVVEVELPEKMVTA